MHVGEVHGGGAANSLSRVARRRSAGRGLPVLGDAGVVGVLAAEQVVVGVASGVSQRPVLGVVRYVDVPVSPRPLDDLQIAEQLFTLGIRNGDHRPHVRQAPRIRRLVANQPFLDSSISCSWVKLGRTPARRATSVAPRKALRFSGSPDAAGGS